MKIIWLLPVVIIVTGVGCSSVPQKEEPNKETIGKSVSELKQGSATDGAEYNAVGMVGGVCSATLISSRVVLYAAHCPCPGSLETAPSTNFGRLNACENRKSYSFEKVLVKDDPKTGVLENTSGRQTIWAEGSVYVNPGYGIPTWLQNDYAVLVLDQPANQLVERVTPIPIERPGHSVKSGDELTMVALGPRGGSCSIGWRQRHKAKYKVDTAGATGFSLKNDDVCGGDSGGPALNNKRHVVGVASSKNIYRPTEQVFGWINSWVARSFTWPVFQSGSVFVVQEDGRLVERQRKGTTWTWIDHGHPDKQRIVTNPGAPMMDKKLFVITDRGRLYERYNDKGRWTWVNHGHPKGLKIILGPGAPIENKSLFVVVEDGRLFERLWQEKNWIWVDHGRPANQRIVQQPGAAMMNEKFFVVAEDGHLYERHLRNGNWVWHDHGTPPGRKVVSMPNATLADSMVFVLLDNGELFARQWDNGKWIWINHGQPTIDVRLSSAVGGADPNHGVFGIGEDGRVYQRIQQPFGWQWIDRAAGGGQFAGSVPSKTIDGTSFFVSSGDGRLFELRLDGSASTWIDHGLPPSGRIL